LKTESPPQQGIICFEADPKSDMPTITRKFAESDLTEVFPANPIREVDFEIRFTPRLRVQAEMWRFQESVVAEYPDISLESAWLPNGATLGVTVFRNIDTARLIKVSSQNLAIAFSAYANFEEFKDEVLKQSLKFCEIFEVSSLTRIGLRYVNEIQLPTQEAESIARYVNPLLDFERIPLRTVQQFAMQLSAQVSDHMIQVRTALLPGPIRTYVLDIDAYTEVVKSSGAISSLLDQFHDTAQNVFLDHVTDNYKDVMRGQR
jgi:uncharacterized protein (TIGR04255 family)